MYFLNNHCKNVERCSNVEYDIEHPMGIQHTFVNIIHVSSLKPSKSKSPG